MDLAILIFQVIGAFFFLLNVCEFGGRVTTAYDEIDYATLQLSWYKFPVELQNILPVVISIVQDKVQLRGIGSVVCSRGTLQQVRKMEIINHSI